MENLNKNLPFLTAIIGFGILLFSIFTFINGVKTELKADIRSVRTELNARMDRVETRISAKIQSVQTKVREVRTELNTRMDRVEVRMDRIEGKLDQLILLQANRMPDHTAKASAKQPKKNTS